MVNQEFWYLTNTQTRDLTIPDIPSIPVLKPRERVEVLQYAEAKTINNSIVLRNYLSKGWILFEQVPVFSQESDFRKIHNEDAQIQGGIKNERYHLTKAEHDALTTNIDASGLHTHNDKADAVHDHDEFSSILDIVTDLSSHINNTMSVHGIVDTSDLVLKSGSINQLSDINSSGEQVDIAVISAHSEAHTIVSHSDTDATGLQLNDLVGGGVITLHNHAHNVLSGLQGGEINQYYHLNQSEYEELINWLDNVNLDTEGGFDIDEGLAVFDALHNIIIFGSQERQVIFEIYGNTSFFGDISLFGGVVGNFWIKRDYQNLYFGNNKDVAVYYDGCDLNIDFTNPSDCRDPSSLQGLVVRADTIIEGTLDVRNRVTGAYHEDLKDMPSSSNTDHDGRYVNLSLVHGSFKESFSAMVSSDGAIVTITIINQDNPSSTFLTIRFSDGDLEFSVPTTIDSDTGGVSVGSDTAPTSNYLYVPISTKVLTVSTIDFPEEEHAKIAYFFLPSASFIQLHGVYINQNWNDPTEEPNEVGHILHISERLRRDNAKYFSGLDPNGTDQDTNSSYFDYVSGTEVYFKMNTGIVYQLHKRNINSFDSRNTVILVKNWFGDSYHDINNLTDITDDSTGTSLGNYFNLVFWTAANKLDEFDPIICNLPSGSYPNLSDAQNDVDGYDDFTIPREFSIDSSTAVLICRMTLREQGVNWSHESTTDLRGQENLSSASGGAAGVVTDFSDNQFTIFNVSDITKILDFDISAVTTSTMRTITMKDADLDLADVLLRDGSVDLTSDWGITANNISFDDNVGVIFGTGDDSKIYYDGSDLIIDAQVAGTGGVWFNNDNQSLSFGVNKDASIFFDINTGLNINIDNPSDIGPRIKLNDDVDILGELTVAGYFKPSSIWLDDNEKILFGDDKDTEIYYNGSDLIIIPDVVGTGGVIVQAQGNDCDTLFKIDGTTNNFTSAAINYNLVSTRTVSVLAGATQFDSYGMSHTLINSSTYDDAAFAFPSNYGTRVILTVSGANTGTTGSTVFEENNYGLHLTASRAGTITATGASQGYHTHGLQVNVTNTISTDTTAAITSNTYGARIVASASGFQFGAGVLTRNIYGLFVSATGDTSGVSTAYGLYLNSVSGADTNYGIWDASGADWVLDGDNQQIIFGEGQEASIYYNNTDLVIDSQLVGSGDVLFPKDNQALALGAGTGGDARIYWDSSDLIIDPKVVSDDAGVRFNAGQSGDIANNFVLIGSQLSSESGGKLIETLQTLDATVDGTDNHFGIYSNVDVEPGATQLTSRAVAFSANFKTGTDTFTGGSTGKVVGGYESRITVNTTGFSAGTVDYLSGYVAWFNTNADPTGTIDSLHGFYAYSFDSTSGATVNNAYGLRVEDVTTATNNYSIYTQLGEVSFGDDVILRNDNDKLFFGTNKDASIFFDINTGLNINIDNPSDIGPRIKLNDDVDILGELTVAGYFKPSSIWLDDNEKILFGDDKDTEIYYDGTDFVVNPKSVGSGEFHVLGGVVVDDYVSSGAGSVAQSGVIRIANNEQIKARNAADVGDNILMYSDTSNRVNINSNNWVFSNTSMMGQDGAVGTPAWHFQSDTNTGIYRIGGDNLGISLGGIKRVDLSTTLVDFTSLGIITTGNITIDSDASKLFFGEIQSASIGYNGTHLLVTPDLVGSGGFFVDGMLSFGNASLVPDVGVGSFVGISGRTISTGTSGYEICASYRSSPQHTAAGGASSAHTDVGVFDYWPENSANMSGRADCFYGRWLPQVPVGGAGTGGNFTGSLVGSFISQILMSNNHGGTATTWSSFQGEAIPASSNFNITNAHGFYQKAISHAGTNNYGLRLEDITGASSNNYAIYTGLGDVSFGDDVILRNDNQVLALGAGTGGDARIYWDATDLIIDTAAIASATGSAVFYGGSDTSINKTRIGAASTNGTGDHLKTFSAPTANGTTRGIYSEFDISQGGTSITTSQFATTANLRVGPVTPFSSATSSTELFGAIDALISLNWAGTGQIDHFNGVHVRGNWDADFTGIINNIYGVHVREFNLGTSPPNLQNLYGVKVGDVTNGVNNYAIYTGLGDVSFGDDVHIRNDEQRIWFGASQNIGLYSIGCDFFIDLNANPSDCTDPSNLPGLSILGSGDVGQSVIAAGLVVNEDGGSTAEYDFRVETNANANAFVVDASANKVIIGPNTEVCGTKVAIEWRDYAAIVDNDYVTRNLLETPTANTHFQAPWAGSVVGISITSGTTHGSYVTYPQYDVWINGASTGLTAEFAAADYSDYATTTRGTHTFVAGDLIQVRVNDWTYSSGTTIQHVTITVFLVFDD